jgi:hypothetical protein
VRRAHQNQYKNPNSSFMVRTAHPSTFLSQSVMPDETKCNPGIVLNRTRPNQGSVYIFNWHKHSHNIESVNCHRSPLDLISCDFVTLMALINKDIYLQTAQALTESARHFEMLDYQAYYDRGKSE